MYLLTAIDTARKMIHTIIHAVIEGLSSVKARLVLRGFEEEKKFRKDTPTCMRESVRLLLMIMSLLLPKRETSLSLAIVNHNHHE